MPELSPKITPETNTPRRPNTPRIWRWTVHSVWVRGLLFVAILLLAAHYGRPWKYGWIRSDEAEEIAENFLIRQTGDLGKYTLIRATEYHRHGAWNRLEEGPLDSGDPAVGYVLRYFAQGTTDEWTVGVSPSGQIYRVIRQQFEDQPGAPLNRETARVLTEAKLASDVGFAVERLTLIQDTLIARPQRNDWGFIYAVSDPLPQPRLRAELDGEELANLSMIQSPSPGRFKTLPDRVEPNRVLAFAFILIGVFIMWQFHKAPLADSEAGIGGGIVFGLILLVRGLTFLQSVLLMPADVPYSGYLARIALSAVVDATQAAILIGLMVATGDSALRDHIPRSTTLTRLGKGLRSWPHAWGNAARWALAAAAGMVVVEVIAMRILGPVGMMSKLPPIMASSLSSPVPALALPAQLTQDTLWDEGFFRLWLLPFTLLFFRPWMGVLVSAGLVTYWAGFNPAQILQAGCLAYLLWNIVAGVLVAGSGILAAVLFHFFALVGLAAITVHWIGFDPLSVTILAVMILAVIGFIAWKEGRSVLQTRPHP